jgi:hypothetical protein
MAEYVTQSEYARMRGYSRQNVGQYKDQGRLVLAPDGKVDVDASDRLINATRDPARGGDRTGKGDRARAVNERAADAGVEFDGGAGNNELASARIRELNARAIKVELEAAQIEGSVVEKAEVERAAMSAGIQLREQHASLVDRMCHELAAESDAAMIHRRLSDEFHKLLSDFSEYLEREADAIEAADLDSVT